MATEPGTATGRLIPPESRLIVVLFVLGLSAMVSATSAPPPDPFTGAGPEDSYDCTGDGVYLYEDINYGGACRRWTAPPLRHPAVIPGSHLCLVSRCPP